MIAAPAASVVAVARSFLGTPYHDQASLRGAGCDCIGLARGVWRELVGAEPVAMPPYSRDWGETGGREEMLDGARQWMIEADLEAAAAGALILFRMRRGAIAKHCGILSGEGTFIHAYERLGVVEQPYSAAWSRRAAAAFLFPAVAGGRSS